MREGWNETGAEWVGADISDAIDVARERLGGFGGTHFVQADVLDLPFRPESFDVVFSEGVLHHTPSTERALKALVPLLRAGRRADDLRRTRARRRSASSPTTTSASGSPT